jgi:type I restriction enzyme M protein
VLANPPFGVEWKSVEREVEDEHATLGFRGRFGAGLPAIDDGSFLFLQHMISKTKPAEEGGSRIAIVFNGSPSSTDETRFSISELGLANSAAELHPAARARPERATRPRRG